MKIDEIEIGAFYSNGDFGKRWMVRQVLAIDSSLCEVSGDEERSVQFKILVGENRRKSFVVSDEEFANWARYEVVRNENSWERAS
ncbi:hypothetical protein BOW53_00820 [Solemya pervernicosa gill symbiont]|uniref:Uncharacterized protein n=2 Tax=Gammaproteobacteria incertae sedis TaxID=118884 RepID=A0A1T2LAM8_9GAMM|nr:hypothetical protein [Candidatus Reidiella endopervernicosa]OOZ42153.1 hypothetical protein BOW53_00820 [Solemya pervernicosa gill symbiont]QKQ27282.1 hypothetical protein HUE57_14065 [Candidatus Reidiella endopervernicosa]